MRKSKIGVIAFALIIVFLASLMPATSTQAATTKYNVKSFGANGSDKKDDTAAIDEALAMARTTSGHVTILVPEGTYYISGPLHIYSDTTLKLNPKAKIVNKKKGGCVMLLGSHLKDGSDTMCLGGSSCTHGKYTQHKNITIQGGIWDMNDNGRGQYEIVTIRHGRNIKVLNATFMHGAEHFLNLSGTKDVVIKNVTFKDAVRAKEYTNDLDLKTKEAIHLDYCNPKDEYGEKAMPHDNTACQNITVTNCKFINVWAGLGTHHSTKGTRANRIVVKNNTAKNVKSYFVWAYNYDNLTIKDNKLYKCGGLAIMEGSKGKIVNNTFSIISKSSAIYDNYPIWVYSSRATITGNTITGSRWDGIMVEKKSVATIKNNIIKNYKRNAIGNKNSRVTESGNKK